MNLKPDIDSLKGIADLKKYIIQLIRDHEKLDPITNENRQIITLLKLIERLLEDKEDVLAEQHSRTTDEIKKEFKDLTDMVENLLALDEISRK
jgi:L-lysine 2,3-aminomutase